MLISPQKKTGQGEAPMRNFALLRSTICSSALAQGQGLPDLFMRRSQARRVCVNVPIEKIKTWATQSKRVRAAIAD